MRLVVDVGGRQRARHEDEQDAAGEERRANPKPAPRRETAALANRRAHADQSATSGGMQTRLARTGHLRPPFVEMTRPGEVGGRPLADDRQQVVNATRRRLFMQSQHRSRRTRIAATSLAVAALAAPGRAGAGPRSTRPQATKGPRARRSAPRWSSRRPRTAASTGARPASALQPAPASCSSGRAASRSATAAACGSLAEARAQVARHAGARDDRRVPAGELIGRERELASLTAMLGDPRPAWSPSPARRAWARRAWRWPQPTAVAPDPRGRRRARRARAARGRARWWPRRSRPPPAPARRAGLGARRAAAALGDERALLVLDNFEHVAPAAADRRRAARRVPGRDGAGHEPPRRSDSRPSARCRWRRWHCPPRMATRGLQAQRRRRAVRRARPGAGPGVSS